MKKYYVNLPGGTKDYQFQQVLELLKSEGHKTNDSRDRHRVKQPDGSLKEQGFLYLFDDRAEAERFAELVRAETRNPAWIVVDVDVESLEELIEQHKQIRDEPLVLAMHYDPGEDPNEIYLLEVIENFGSNGINPDRELFEMTFPGEDSQGDRTGQTWHLVLTNPQEFDRALREKWDHAEKIRGAAKAGRYEYLFMNQDEGVRIRDLIHA